MIPPKDLREINLAGAADSVSAQQEHQKPERPYDEPSQEVPSQTASEIATGDTGERNPDISDTPVSGIAGVGGTDSQDSTARALGAIPDSMLAMQAANELTFGDPSPCVGGGVPSPGKAPRAIDAVWEIIATAHYHSDKRDFLLTHEQFEAIEELAIQIKYPPEEQIKYQDCIQPRPLSSADFAKLIRKNEEMRASIESAINWLDLLHPAFAKSELLRALGRKVQ